MVDGTIILGSFDARSCPFRTNGGGNHFAQALEILST